MPLHSPNFHKLGSFDTLNCVGCPVVNDCERRAILDSYSETTRPLKREFTSSLGAIPYPALINTTSFGRLIESVTCVLPDGNRIEHKFTTRETFPIGKSWDR